MAHGVSTYVVDHAAENQIGHWKVRLLVQSIWLTLCLTVIRPCHPDPACAVNGIIPGQTPNMLDRVCSGTIQGPLKAFDAARPKLWKRLIWT